MSKDEGKFKKQVKNLLKYWRERQVTYIEDKTHMRSDAGALSSNIIQIINNAKKELESAFHEDKINFESYKSYRIFQKWFGDST